MRCTAVFIACVSRTGDGNRSDLVSGIQLVVAPRECRAPRPIDGFSGGAPTPIILSAPAGSSRFVMVGLRAGAHAWQVQLTVTNSAVGCCARLSRWSAFL
eukprot:scaffold4440_cov109-Isochrysis_galbana.AAC.7